MVLDICGLDRSAQDRVFEGDDGACDAAVNAGAGIDIGRCAGRCRGIPADRIKDAGNRVAVDAAVQREVGKQSGGIKRDFPFEGIVESPFAAGIVSKCGRR